jgi:hypothetical protein
LSFHSVGASPICLLFGAGRKWLVSVGTTRLTLNGSMKRRLHNEASVRSTVYSSGRNTRSALIL